MAENEERAARSGTRRNVIRAPDGRIVTIITVPTRQGDEPMAREDSIRATVKRAVGLLSQGHLACIAGRNFFGLAQQSAGRLAEEYPEYEVVGVCLKHGEGYWSAWWANVEKLTTSQLADLVREFEPARAEKPRQPKTKEQGTKTTPGTPLAAAPAVAPPAAENPPNAG